jgi:molybdenum cofactor guanylyltransferase
MFYILSMDHNNILGVVLAGGQSKRFGQDKSQVTLDGKILIDYILSEIIDEFNEILIVSNHDINFMSSKKIFKIEDYKKGLGPLGGILSAMKWIRSNNKNYKWISTFPSDTPFFNKKLLHRFYRDAPLDHGKLFFIKSNNTRHNIFGLWSVELLDQLEEDLIKNGERKVETWADKVGVQTVQMQFENYDPFFNINTKEDLDKAKELLKNND